MALLNLLQRLLFCHGEACVVCSVPSGTVAGSVAEHAMLRGVRPLSRVLSGRRPWRALVGVRDAAVPLIPWAPSTTHAPASPGTALSQALGARTKLSTSFLAGQSFGAQPTPQSNFFRVRHFGQSTSSLLERETVSYLRSVRTGTEVYLIGTAHVSKASAEEVKEVLELVRPQYVGVELDSKRAEKLMSGRMYADSERLGLLAMLRDLMHAPGDIGQKVLTVAMRSMYKMLQDTGLEPGKEFKVAMDEAPKLGAEIVLLDRSANETMARLRQVLSLWDIVSLFTRRVDPTSIPPVLREVGTISPDNIEERTEQLKTREAVREITQFMEKMLPDVVRVMVHERDAFIFNRLRQLRGCVVAVVGMAHVDGIERLWKENEVFGVEK